MCRCFGWPRATLRRRVSLRQPGGAGRDLRLLAGCALVTSERVNMIGPLCGCHLLVKTAAVTDPLSAVSKCTPSGTVTASASGRRLTVAVQDTRRRMRHGRRRSAVGAADPVSGRLHVRSPCRLCARLGMKKGRPRWGPPSLNRLCAAGLQRTRLTARDRSSRPAVVAAGELTAPRAPHMMAAVSVLVWKVLFMSENLGCCGYRAFTVSNESRHCKG